MHQLYLVFAPLSVEKSCPADKQRGRVHFRSESSAPVKHTVDPFGIREAIHGSIDSIASEHVGYHVIRWKLRPDFLEHPLECIQAQSSAVGRRYGTKNSLCVRRFTGHQCPPFGVYKCITNLFLRSAPQEVNFRRGALYVQDFCLVDSRDGEDTSHNDKQGVKRVCIDDESSYNECHTGYYVACARGESPDVSILCVVSGIQVVQRGPCGVRKREGDSQKSLHDQ